MLTASNFVDDLQPLPAQRLEGKLCFYAQGPVAFDINLNTTIPSYNRVLNIYSTHGYYFLTEESGDAAEQLVAKFMEEICDATDRERLADLAAQAESFAKAGQIGGDDLNKIFHAIDVRAEEGGF